MELLYEYLNGQIVNYCFMVTDEDNQLFAINIESYEIKPSMIYNRVFEGQVVMEDWVYNSVNMRTTGWKNRLKFLLLENGYGQPTIYKLLGYNEIREQKTVRFTFTAKKQVD